MLIVPVNKASLLAAPILIYPIRLFHNKKYSTFSPKIESKITFFMCIQVNHFEGVVYAENMLFFRNLNSYVF